MKTNEQLQKDVQDAIKWQPLLKAAEVGVTAKDGVVSLTGIVSSFTKKLEAEKRTAKVEADLMVAEGKMKELELENKLLRVRIRELEE